jgi:hypothetical protein
MSDEDRYDEEQAGKKRRAARKTAMTAKQHKNSATGTGGQTMKKKKLL